MLKICCTCKSEKEIYCFGKNKNTSDGLSAQCKQCAKEYRDTHKNKKKDYPSSNIGYKRLYRISNKDRANSLRKNKYQNNKEKYKVQNKINYTKRRDKRLVSFHSYYIETKEVRSQYNKQYRLDNPDYISLKNRQRKKLLHDLPTIKQSEINELMNDHNHKCYYCGIIVQRRVNLHLDHKIPLSRGGSHNINNLAPSCRWCNLRKGTKTDIEYRQQLMIANVNYHYFEMETDILYQYSIILTKSFSE